MQREIKLKAFHIALKVMCNVVSINFDTEEIEICLHGQVTLTYFKNVEILRYTGLKDKNGKEIYEGDIVKHEFEFGNGKGIVYYSTPKFSLKEIGVKAVCDCFTWDEWEKFEAIGNIYDNPELLQEVSNE